MCDLVVVAVVVVVVIVTVIVIVDVEVDCVKVCLVVELYSTVADAVDTVLYTSTEGLNYTSTK